MVSQKKVNKVTKRKLAIQHTAAIITADAARKMAVLRRVVELFFGEPLPRPLIQDVNDALEALLQRNPAVTTGEVDNLLKLTVEDFKLNGPRQVPTE